MEACAVSAFGKAWGLAFGAAFGLVVATSETGAAQGGGLHGVATKRAAAQQNLHELFAPPLLEIAQDSPDTHLPIAPNLAPVYKQNQPVAPADTEQAATEFASKLLANLPALPDDDSAVSASGTSAPIAATLPTEKPHGTQTTETFQAQQEQQAQKAALLKRQDDETALIMILLELA